MRSPMWSISATASRISAGNLSERISVAETDDELGRLAGVLNTTFTRLEAAFAQQKQFTADASHELRTPIAVLISEAQTALARTRSAAEYRETVEACLDTAQKMRRLMESLLELARFDAGQEEIDAGGGLLGTGPKNAKNKSVRQLSVFRYRSESERQAGKFFFLGLRDTFLPEKSIMNERNMGRVH